MIDRRCVGCNRIVEGNPYQAFLSCKTYINPEVYPWRVFTCPLASHIKAEASKSQQKVRVGQQKQKRVK